MPLGGPTWLSRTDLRQELVRALVGFGLLLLGVLIGFLLFSRAKSAVCDSGWTIHDGHCYKVCTTRLFLVFYPAVTFQLLLNKTFPEADHECQYVHGAQLASIHSSTEMEFVASKFSYSTSTVPIWQKKGLGKIKAHPNVWPVSFTRKTNA